MVQIYLHPGANCAHERKLYNFYTLRWEISINARCFLLRCCLKSIKNKFQVVSYRNEYHLYYFNHSSTRYLNLYGYRRSPPPIHTFLGSKHQGGSSVGSMSTLYASGSNIVPHVRLSWIFPSNAYLRKASCQLLTKSMDTRH